MSVNQDDTSSVLQAQDADVLQAQERTSRYSLDLEAWIDKAQAEREKGEELSERLSSYSYYIQDGLTSLANRVKMAAPLPMPGNLPKYEHLNGFEDLHTWKQGIERKCLQAGYGSIYTHDAAPHENECPCPVCKQFLDLRKRLGAWAIDNMSPSLRRQLQVGSLNRVMKTVQTLLETPQHQELKRTLANSIIQFLKQLPWPPLDPSKGQYTDFLAVKNFIETVNDNVAQLRSLATRTDECSDQAIAGYLRSNISMDRLNCDLAAKLETWPQQRAQLLVCAYTGRDYAKSHHPQSTRPSSAGGRASQSGKSNCRCHLPQDLHLKEMGREIFRGHISLLM